MYFDLFLLFETTGYLQKKNLFKEGDFLMIYNSILPFWTLPLFQIKNIHEQKWKKVWNIESASEVRQEHSFIHKRFVPRHMKQHFQSLSMNFHVCLYSPKNLT